MAEAKACSECGGKMVEVEIAGGDERLSLIKQNFGKFFSKDALAPLERATVCTACGYTKLFVDPEKLRQRITRRLTGA